MAEFRFGTGRPPEAAPVSVLPQNVHPSLKPSANLLKPDGADGGIESPASAAAAVPGVERTDYGASGGRKTAFSFLMLLLLPFFASLPIMMYQRINHGLWFDTWQLFLFAAVFSAHHVSGADRTAVFAAAHSSVSAKVRSNSRCRRGADQHPCCVTPATTFPITPSKLSK